MAPVPSTDSAVPGLFRGTRSKLVIAALSAATLAGGLLLKPRTVSGPITPPKEHSAPLLEEEAQRRSPAGIFTALQDLGGRVVEFTVAVPPAGEPPPQPSLDIPDPPRPSTPAGYGVVVSADGVVLTHGLALAGRATLPIHVADGSIVHARLLAFEPVTDLALLQLSSAAVVHASPIATDAPIAGAFAAAAGRWNGADMVVPVFVTRVDDVGVHFTAGGQALAPGTPLFTSDAGVFAIAAGPARRGWAYPVEAAVERLRGTIAAGTAQPASLGLVLQPLTPPLLEVFGSAGALVSDLVPGGPAAAGGILPGDVLVAINDTTVDSVGTAQRTTIALDAGAATLLRVVRNGSAQSVEVRAGAAFDVIALARRADRTAPDAPEARALLTGEQLRASRIPAAARVIAVNGSPVETRAQMARVLRRTPASAIHLELGGRRHFAVVRAAQ